MPADSPISVFDADSVICGERAVVALPIEAFVAGFLQFGADDDAGSWIGRRRA